MKRILRRAASDANMLDLHVPSAGAIALSIVVLISQFEAMIAVIFPSTRQITKLPNGTANRLLMRRVDEAHWCPYWTDTHSHQLSRATLYYLSALPRIHSKADHYRCTKEVCSANNTDADAYETKHTSNCNGCAFLGPDMLKLHKLTKSGDVPLIAVTKTSSGLELDVVPADFQTPYTAISHVWSDGMETHMPMPYPAVNWRR